MSQTKTEARELLDDKEQFDQLMDNVETTLREKGDRFGIEITDEAIEAVQEYIAQTMVASANREEDIGGEGLDHPDTPEAWFGQLLDEFSDPSSRQAHTNVGVAIGAKSREVACLRELTGASLRQKYSNDHRNSTDN